jgi:signal transduction histidine kinase
VRLRLTLLYGSVFLVSGAVLLGITYFLLRQSTGARIFSAKGTAGGFVVTGPHGPVRTRAVRIFGPTSVGAVATGTSAGPLGPVTPAVSGGAARRAPGKSSSVSPGGGLPAPPAGLPLTLKQAQAQARQLEAAGNQQHNEELHQLLIESGIALAIMAVLSMGLGWFLAGRALRPLQTITQAARAISATNLHRRLSLAGPNDELRELGDTFDELLERLERSFQAQRQFVANASHELRTPLTLERTLLEVALADPDASAETLRSTCERVLAVGEEQERIIGALLTLARSDRGLARREPIDLEPVSRALLISRRPEMTRRGLRLDSELRSAPTAGDPHLLERLIANLLDNAIRHNSPGGWVRVASGVESGRAVISVSNSGPVVPTEDVERLSEPFRRLGGARSARGDGHGLGLSIVGAIATAHRATLSVRARQQGGLCVDVAFAAAGPGVTHAVPDAPAGEESAARRREESQGIASVAGAGRAY